MTSDRKASAANAAAVPPSPRVKDLVEVVADAIARGPVRVKGPGPVAADYRALEVFQL